MKIESWLDKVSSKEWVWYAKRLTANDTGATESHQAGIYIPKPVLWSLFPSMNSGSNPDARFPALVMPYCENRNLRAIWYNEGSRNESRVTQWNRPSRILNPDLTGGIVLFAFFVGVPEHAVVHAEIWICQDEADEIAIENLIGDVEPGEGVVHHPEGKGAGESLLQATTSDCSLSDADISAEWLLNFPSGQTLVEYALHRMSGSSGSPDIRLIKRRECETAVFYSVERASVLPRIRSGFSSVDEFVDFANSITNRRKSRAGKSLELHLKAIFREERLPCAHGEISENNKRPDFLFPSVEAYYDPSWPAKKLRMLAAKTTCKDRWRQILNEADRIPFKHLITLQQGVSTNQFQEMKRAGVTLVVPATLHESYPRAIRDQLVTLEDFITETNSLLNQ